MRKKLEIIILPISKSKDESHFGYKVFRKKYSDGQDWKMLRSFFGKKVNGRYILRNDTELAHLDESFSFIKADNFLYDEAWKFARRKNPYSIIAERPDYI